MKKIVYIPFNTHVQVLFRTSHLANDFNFFVTTGRFRHVGVEVKVDFATSLV